MACLGSFQVMSARIDEFDDLQDTSTINNSSISIDQVGLLFLCK